MVFDGTGDKAPQGLKAKKTAKAGMNSTSEANPKQSQMPARTSKKPSSARLMRRQRKSAKIKRLPAALREDEIQRA
jgi:hypothetical protein